MNKVVYEIKADKNNEAIIVPLADVHYGNKYFSLTEFENVLFWCKEHNAYICLNGDLIENTLKSSPASIFETDCSVQSQMAYIVEKLKWFAENKKIIFMNEGNHEDRALKETGISPSQMIVSLLAQYDNTLPQRYSQDGTYAFIKLNHSKSKVKKDKKSVFTMYALHGTGGGTTIGAKVNKLDNMRQVIPAQIYIRSHTHEPDYHTGSYFEIDPHNSCDVKEITAHFINTGSFLKYGGYSSKAGMKPTSRAVPVITLKVIERRIKGKKDIRYTDKIVKVDLKQPSEFAEN